MLMTASEIGVRESRRIEGDYILTQEDLVSCRRFDDSIAVGNYDIDIHNPEGSEMCIRDSGNTMPMGSFNDLVGIITEKAEKYGIKNIINGINLVPNDIKYFAGDINVHPNDWDLCTISKICCAIRKMII